MCQPCLPLFLSLPPSRSLLSPRCLSFIWSYSPSPASISSSLLSLFSFFSFLDFLTVAFSFSPRFLSPPYLSLFVSTSVNIFAACFSLSLSFSVSAFLHSPLFCLLSFSAFHSARLHAYRREKKRGRNQVTEIGQHIGSSPSYIKVLDRSISVCRWSWHQLLERC